MRNWLSPIPGTRYYALHGMRTVQCLGGFRLGGNCFLNHKVHDGLPDDDAAIMDRDAMLLCD